MLGVREFPIHNAPESITKRLKLKYKDGKITGGEGIRQLSLGPRTLYLSNRPRAIEHNPTKPCPRSYKPLE